MLPVLVNYFSEEEEMEISFSYHVAHCLIFLMGAAFFALDIPQRWYPGRFDFFGQGHHLFHICVCIVVIIQLKACQFDFLTNRDLIVGSRIPPSIIYSFFSLFLVTSYYIYVIINFYQMIGHNFDENGNLKQNWHNIQADIDNDDDDDDDDDHYDVNEKEKLKKSN
jgi:hypothetical protein